MKKLILFIPAITFCLGIVRAQDLKVISATNQCWSGGMVRLDHINCGTDYVIRVSPVNKDIVLDSLYIGSYLAVKLNPQQTDTINNTYIIHASCRPIPIAITRHFTGAGLVIYTRKGKSKILTIENFVGLKPRNNLQ